jgi:hypothetical protein
LAALRPQAPRLAAFAKYFHQQYTMLVDNNNDDLAAWMAAFF